MLDLALKKGGEVTGSDWWRTGTLDVGIFVKDTCQKVPLCDSSCHYPSLHVAWPEARITHFRRLCSSLKLTKIAIERFVDMFQKDLPRHRWLETREQTKNRSSLAYTGTWLVIPFHFSLLSCRFSSVVTEMARFAAIHGIADLTPRIAWSRMHGNIGEIAAAHFYSVVG